MSDLVMDSTLLNQTLNEINRLMHESRAKLDDIINKNDSLDTYEELSKSRDLVRLYANCADDYAKLSYLQTGVNESIMDLRGVRRKLIKEQSTIAPSLVKSYKSRIDLMIEELGTFKEAIQSARQGMEARVRFYNSCSYTSYDKIIGAKC